MKKYINIKNGSEVETVDEFPYNNKEERNEAKRCLKEYQLSDCSNTYYMSSRSTKEWKNRS